MNLSQRVVWIAILLVAFSAANLVLTNLAGTTQLLAVQLVRFGLTCLLAFFLAKGRSWARWLTVVLLGLGCVISVISFFALFEKAFAVAPVRMIWLLGMGLVFGALSGFLAFSKKVASECASTVAGNPAIQP